MGLELVSAADAATLIPARTTNTEIKHFMCGTACENAVTPSCQLGYNSVTTPVNNRASLMSLQRNAFATGASQPKLMIAAR
jgi:hypothetical protein